MKNTKTLTIPMMVTKGIVIFPGMSMHFDITSGKNIAALQTASMTDKRVFLVSQSNYDAEPTEQREIFRVGVIAVVKQILTTPDRATRVLVEARSRARVRSVSEFDKYDVADVVLFAPRSVKMPPEQLDAYLRTLKELFAEYASMLPKVPPELIREAESTESLERLFDLIVFNTYLKPEDKQDLLEIAGFRGQVKRLIGILSNEINVLRFETEIHEQIRSTMENNQREYLLREQMKAISKQLGGVEEGDEEVYEYCDEIQALGFPEETEEKLLREANKMLKVSPSSQEYGLIKAYLDTVLEMPWNTYTVDTVNLKKAEKQLDRDHYGLIKVKERILEIISVRKLNPEIKGQIICLVGPPGVGKTSVGRSIAEALGRRFVRISLGGVRDEAEIRGHRKTYLGSMPGRVIAALKQAKCMNPVMMFDEIDKMGNDYKGDPASAMLEVLDPEQNVAFTDHFMEIPVDLSDTLFITTANTTDTIPAPLLDRMEVIELGSYTREEKFKIAKKHLLPKVMKKHGITRDTLKISDKAIYAVIDGYTREAGVRRLEKRLAAICRKTARKLVDGAESVSVTPANLKDFLGIPKYLAEALPKTNEVGVVTGLAWTSAGGVTMPLEVLVMEGTGKVEVTGSLGDVMKESSRIAVSLVRSLSSAYGIDGSFYKEKDLHIHAPEGAVPKDGPSAGVTMTTALVSALSGIPVKRDVAMTGEITLHGKVLPIGGLREKSMAAYRAGVKTVIFPKENEPDLEEVDEIVKENITFIPAEDIRTVLSNALVSRPIAARRAKRSVSTERKGKNELQQSRI
ncbi:MAG: endopeptidase La [Bacteroides sp.]|nr:endopeptidase La [Eubacterium sp.]MCM1418658.1 endopeptidase La [Roseburia sp.]MCM1462712.1 endopeptidase La [Bacteroides sp.]